MRYYLFLLFMALVCPALAQPARQTTYCNPIDLDYRYNFEQQNEGISYRSGADPVIVRHKGEYYLFATIQGGYWRSPDLVNWRFVTPSMWPMEDMCAPAVESVGDTLYLFQSTFEQRPILYSTAPATGKLDFYNRWLPRLPKDIGPWDPALFHDKDTDKWYMYWGSSNVYPIFGAELDKNRRLSYADRNAASAYQPMFWLDPWAHGWERFGPNHADLVKPFTEGAWMTKYKAAGRPANYYLQYGAPGTEYNVYANGTYVSTSPLGPWEYAPYNPIAYHPGGYAVGCGHGNTFQDAYGNYWNTGTSWIGLVWGMERRMVMHPAGFDKTDQLYADTRFGDWPHQLPTRTWNTQNGPGRGRSGQASPGQDGTGQDSPGTDDTFTGWMLLNYKKPVTASSALDTLRAEFAVDENARTFWATRNKPGETLTVDLGSEQTIRAVQVNYVDHKNTIFRTDTSVYTQFRLLGSADGKRWRTLADLTDTTRYGKRDRACAYVELSPRQDGQPERARYVRYEHVYTAGPYLAINGFRLFGTGNGKLPSVPAGLIVRRQPDDRNADLSWQPVAGAVGYNVRWGIAPDKLYQTYQFWADERFIEKGQPFELRALNRGVPYFFAIEAFNENGVSALSTVVPAN